MKLGHWLDAPTLDQFHRSHRRSSHCRVCIHPRFHCHRGEVKPSHAHLSSTISVNVSPAKTQWHHLQRPPLVHAFAFKFDVLQLTQLRRNHEARNPEFRRLVRAPFALSAGSSELLRSLDTRASFESELPMA